jgi:hypothetical protein
MIFPQGTLRVVSPVTEDGNRPKIIDGMPVYKETFLPKTAKRALERQNNNLPNHLKKKIEVLKEDYVVPTQGTQQVAAVPEKAKGKPGPKPKQNAQTN